MNERIKELAEQANIHFSRVGILDGDPNGSARQVGYSKMEKFAELIVEECHHLIVINGIDDLDVVKKHFGVEE
jgi:hypothetical protein